MTIKEKIIEFLTSNGMFDDQAAATFELVKNDPANKAMSGRWNEDVSAYPLQMLPIIQMSARRSALAYIDEHCPLAWFRPMFCDDTEAELARLETEQPKPYVPLKLRTDV